MTTAPATDALESIHQPASVDELVQQVRAAHDRSTALYPIGGATSLGYGLPISQPGLGIDLTQLSQVIDYPVADMTITVQAGIRMAELDRILIANRQQLPLDVPQAEQATLGGVLATNFSGPRRLGYGTARDYVIGIRAVEGRGNLFAGGGRVVKNVAGYDFCKLLIGSLGTLAITTEVTLKLVPRATHRLAVIAAPRDLQQLQTGLADLVSSRTQPTAVEWLLGSDWQPMAKRHGWPAAAKGVGWLCLLYEGMAEAVDWSVKRVQDEWRRSCGLDAAVLDPDAVEPCLNELTEFPAGDAALVLKANVLPSEICRMVQTVVEDQPDVTVQAHAGCGIVYFRFPQFPAGGLAQTLTSRWQPMAAVAGGNVIILANRERREMTRRAVWGSPSGPVDLMRRIKTEFDPRGILNPHRFVY